ncbi:MAG TPA: hypothetical protein VNV42_08810, partial [Solirubrobacteraceae bacterium]|nr:hypothetical protein [Solirubrobacteraceae bacterium]
MKMRRALETILLGVGLLAGSLAFSSAPALGLVGHQYLSRITESDGSPLVFVSGLTFDSGGNLFVADQSGIDMFTAGDVFTSRLGVEYSRGVAINDTTGDVYDAQSDGSLVDVLKPASGGQYKLLQELQLPKEIGDFVYAAANNSSGPYGGYVYVMSDKGTIYAIKPNAEGELVDMNERLSSPEEGFSLLTKNANLFPGGLTVDRATGEVYVANPGRGFVDEYNSNDVYQGHLRVPPKSVESEPAAVAIDEATGELYVVDVANSVVDQFDASGKYVGSIAYLPSGSPFVPDGVAVSATGDVYIANQGPHVVGEIGEVDVFGPSGLVPEVTTAGAGEVSRAGAKLEGIVNPEGKEVTSCEFEYGTSPAASGQTAACTIPPGSGSSPVAVSAEVGGLTLGTEYYYRLVASYAGSSARGEGAAPAFRTLVTVPGLKTEAATSIERPAKTVLATLNGSLAPDGVDTHYYFEYGETEAYGSATPEVDAGEAFATEHAQTQITGLKSYTVYDFRIVATNSFGIVFGANQRFSTTTAPPAPPVVGGAPATGLSQFAATLEGTLETGEALVDYHFEYGTSTAYGEVAPVPDDDAPITAEKLVVSQPVSGLQAGTTYHYRLVASSPGGTEVEGSDETFTTPAIPAPTVATGGAEGVGVGSATLSGA